MINLNKLKKIAYIAFDNALRLHYDAISLYKDGRYPSAFYLSVLSQEELGKMYMVSDFVWDSKINGRLQDSEEKEWVKLLYKHPHKQHSFLSYSPTVRQFSVHTLAQMQAVLGGSLEIKKQNAVYVGLGRFGGKVDIKSKIKHPYQVGKSDSQKQITRINDWILMCGIGVRFGQFNIENEEIETMIKNKRFIKNNFSNWNHISRSVRLRIRTIQKFFKDEIIPA